MDKKDVVLGTKSKPTKYFAIAGVIVVAGILFMSQRSTPQGVSGDTTLRVSLSALGTTVKFYEYVSQSGAKMSVMVVNGTDGNIHAALNTCEVCYASGKGHYTQDGEWLICTNCGRKFHINNLGEVHGGCNPVPFKYEVIGNEIVINASELSAKDWYFNY
jgi:uncharacterized membrane protein